MTAKRTYYLDGREIDEADAFDDNGVIRDGVTMLHSGVSQEMVAGHTLDRRLQAADRCPRWPPLGGGGDHELRRRQLAEAWRGGLQAGDEVVVDGERFEVLGYNAEDRMVDAAQIRTVSNPKFPANREKNREFCKIRPPEAIFHAQSASEFSGLQRNSLRNGTRNFWSVNREFFGENRAKRSSHAIRSSAAIESAIWAGPRASCGGMTPPGILTALVDAP